MTGEEGGKKEEIQMLASSLLRPVQRESKEGVTVTVWFVLSALPLSCRAPR